MTLNGVIALILRFSTEYDSFAGQLRHSGLRSIPARMLIRLSLSNAINIVCRAANS